MSDREFLDLDEDLLDDGPDAPVGDWDDDLMEDFPADDPAAADAAPAAPAAAAPAEAKQEAGKVAKKAKRPRRRRRHGGAGTGLLCFVLVLLSGLTLASGLLTATGAAPEALLDFSGFSDPMAIGDFQAHPINAFWLAALITLMASIVAAVAVSKRFGGVSASTSEQDEVLDAIRHLDPEKPETWEREELQSDPDLAAVVTGLLGHYNLQQAKLERYVGLEGELHRLEKAMVDESADDLQADWDSPAAGSLADQALRLLQARDDLSRDASQNQQALTEQGPDLVAGLRDARSWQTAGLDQVKQQGSGVERIFRRLSKLAEESTDDPDLAPRQDRLRQAIAAVRQELESLPARGADGESAPDASLNALIERASRLAFQIAMEVARLGAKGERLLPLTQDLEELTTELRGMVDRDRGQSDEEDPRARILANVRGRLAELDPDAVADGGSSDHAKAVAELAPAAGEVAAGLANLIKNFSVQDERLSRVQQLASDLTGIQPDAAGDPNAAPEESLLVDRFDPFASGEQSDGGLVADPFASGKEPSIFETDDGTSDDFARTALPGAEDQLLGPAESAESEPAAPLVGELTLEPTVDTPGEPTMDAPAAAADLTDAGDPAPPAPADSPLPSDDEKVYDLTEFDALPLTDGQPTAGIADQERIYELSEFGAVKIE